jgi:acetoin utilization deacetylase AcuC-like enzyme
MPLILMNRLFIRKPLSATNGGVATWNVKRPMIWTLSLALSVASLSSSAHSLRSAVDSATTTNNINNNNRRKIPIFFDSTNEWHRDIQYHPEQPARVAACVKALATHDRLKDQVKLVDVMDEPPAQEQQGVTPINRLLMGNDNNDDDDDNNNNYSLYYHHEPFSVKELQHARDMLVLAHSEEFVTALEQRCRKARQNRIESGKIPLGYLGRIDEDTFLTTESFDVCLRAAAAWIRAVDVALDGSSQPRTTLLSSDTTATATAAMALTRPPGHHATTNLANGFCPLNFAAAAAIHAMESHPTIQVSIFDWDVHYGQGVADILQRYERARYVSIHQYPAFPYEGGSKRTIHGRFQNILTLPMAAETSWTCGYQALLEEQALPFLIPDYSKTSSCNAEEDKNETTTKWEPELLLICAGYDALDSDELASVNLQAKDFGTMTRALMQRFKMVRGRPASIALGLEGGYQLSPMAGGGNLPDAVIETIQALVE